MGLARLGQGLVCIVHMDSILNQQLSTHMHVESGLSPPSYGFTYFEP